MGRKKNYKMIKAFIDFIKNGLMSDLDIINITLKNFDSTTDYAKGFQNGADSMKYEMLRILVERLDGLKETVDLLS